MRCIRVRPCPSLSLRCIWVILARCTRQAGRPADRPVAWTGLDCSQPRERRRLGPHAPSPASAAATTRRPPPRPAAAPIVPQAEGATGWILDLRDNPGGIVGQGMEVAELFLHPGDVFARVRDQTGTETVAQLGQTARAVVGADPVVSRPPICTSGAAEGCGLTWGCCAACTTHPALPRPGQALLAMPREVPRQGALAGHACFPRPRAPARAPPTHFLWLPCAPLSWFEFENWTGGAGEPQLRQHQRAASGRAARRRRSAAAWRARPAHVRQGPHAGRAAAQRRRHATGFNRLVRHACADARRRRRAAPRPGLPSRPRQQSGCSELLGAGWSAGGRRARRRRRRQRQRAAAGA